eukprot:5606896-Pleurochrysis_carterae.AAC.2
MGTRARMTCSAVMFAGNDTSRREKAFCVWRISVCSLQPNVSSECNPDMKLYAMQQYFSTLSALCRELWAPVAGSSQS